MSIETDIARLADATADLAKSNYQAEIASVLGEIASLLTELVKQHRILISTAPAAELARLQPLPLQKAESDPAKVAGMAAAASRKSAKAAPPVAEPAAPPLAAPRGILREAEPASTAAPAPNGQSKGPTFDEVVAIAQEVARRKTPPVAIKLINAHGAQKLADMDPAQYPAFYAAAQVELGQDPQF